MGKLRRRSPEGGLLNIGAVAQLGERGLCKPEVVGSIPISSTFEGGSDRRRAPSGVGLVGSTRQRRIVEQGFRLVAPGWAARVSSLGAARAFGLGVL